MDTPDELRRFLTSPRRAAQVTRALRERDRWVEVDIDALAAKAGIDDDAAT